jgi:cytochrome c oxidase assembly protein subunit 11
MTTRVANKQTGSLLPFLCSLALTGIAMGVINERHGLVWGRWLWQCSCMILLAFLLYWFVDLIKNMRMPANIQSKRQRAGLMLTCVAVLMFGFSYVLIPFFHLVCEQFGIHGKISTQAKHHGSSASIASRPIEFRLFTTINASKPWRFEPLHYQVKATTGSKTALSLDLQNMGQHPMAARVVFALTPAHAMHFLTLSKQDKTRLTLQPGQRKRLTFHFTVDKHLPQRFEELTIAYTLFTEKTLTGKLFQSQHRPVS